MEDSKNLTNYCVVFKWSTRFFFNVDEVEVSGGVAELSVLSCYLLPYILEFYREMLGNGVHLFTTFSSLFSSFIVTFKIL